MSWHSDKSKLEIAKDLKTFAWKMKVLAFQKLHSWEILQILLLYLIVVLFFKLLEFRTLRYFQYTVHPRYLTNECSTKGKICVDENMTIAFENIFKRSWPSVSDSESDDELISWFWLRVLRLMGADTGSYIFINLFLCVCDVCVDEHVCYCGRTSLNRYTQFPTDKHLQSNRT